MSFWNYIQLNGLFWENIMTLSTSHLSLDTWYIFTWTPQIMTLSTTRCFIHLCRFYCHLVHVIDNWSFFHLRYLLFYLLEVVCPSPEEDIYGIDSSPEHVTGWCLKSYKNGLYCRMKTANVVHRTFISFHIIIFSSAGFIISFSLYLLLTLSAVFHIHIIVRHNKQLEVDI